jgi:hypothetical protein
MVFKRDWIFRVGLLDETHNFHGGEIIFAGYLFMEGCKFANVNRVLNYRRYHTERLYKNLSDICKDERDAQDKIFFDPRCPKRVRSVRNLAHVNMYLYFICLAFAQDETVLGRELVLNAISLKPDILSGKPCRLVNAFLEHSIEDENKNHKTLLKKFFSQLPSDLVWLSKYENWAIARGYFDKGMRAIIWGRIEDGEENLSKLDKMTFQVDESYFQSLTHQLMDYASEFGPTAAEGVILILDPYLKKIGGLGNIMRLRGSYVINRAFRAYRRGKFSVVPLNVLTAVTYEPKYIVNKGVLSILFRSLIKILSGIIKNLYGLYSRSVNSMIFNILIVVSF